LIGAAAPFGVPSAGAAFGGNLRPPWLLLTVVPHEHLAVPNTG
jgi:hypothetical protein